MQEQEQELYLFFFIVILVVVGIMLITREFWCWYWKINARQKELKKTNQLLAELLVQLGGKQITKRDNNPVYNGYKPQEARILSSDNNSESINANYSNIEFISEAISGKCDFCGEEKEIKECIYTDEDGQTYSKICFSCYEKLRKKIDIGLTNQQGKAAFDQ